MSEFLGSRISLISKSDIRYVGTLASINSDDATVSLENVRSFGTEGRKGTIEDEVQPSDQVYEYIVFRGTDVKDLRIEEAAAAKENNPPPQVPNDPAIVGARPRPVNVAPGPSGPPQGPPHQGPGPIGHPGPHGAPNQHGPPGAPFGYFPPPPMGGGWGRAGGPSPGPMPGQYGGMPYPPAGWFPPPGQEFPPHMDPRGPGPWNNYAGSFPGGPGGPGGSGGPPGFPGVPGQGRQSASQTPSNQGPSQKPAPIGPSGDKKPATPSQQGQQQTEPKPVAQPPNPQSVSTGPPPPVESKPSVEEVQAKSAALTSGASALSQDNKNIPTGPKSNRPMQILPAVPLPAGLTSKMARPPQAAKPAEQSNAPPAAALHDAAEAAKQAVAMAMASIDATAAQQATQGAIVDNLAKKVNEMRVSAARGGQSSRGDRGRGRGGPRPAGKVEVPDSDFDFASANAKFNKQDLVKEAIAGSPLTEAANGDLAQPEDPAESSDSVEPAYNKSRSFFDNISSDLKDRESSAQKPGGREWRGEEQRKNMETFGQGSVDGGYRGYRGGRGRGRGGRGRGFRGGRGGNNGFRPPQQTQGPQ